MGFKSESCGIKNVSPPPDVQMAMEKQMQTERERRANVLWLKVQNKVKF